LPFPSTPHEDAPPLADLPPFYAPVLEDLARVEEHLRDLARVDYAPLGMLLTYILEPRGKRIRPVVTLLASRFHPAPDPHLPVRMATAVELLHIATLVHDDTVDKASVRRGRSTLSALWGPGVAVLVGDYIFASSAVCVCDTGNIRVVRRFAQTIMQLATGELMEYFMAFDPQQDRTRYFDRIYNKTASLFATSAESGAVLSGAPEPWVQALREYGRNIGMAFQIVDDILDFQGTEEELGKPALNDLRGGLMTLPAILLAERYPDENPIPRYFADPKGEGAEALLRRAQEMVRHSSILQDAYEEASRFCQQAVSALEVLPPIPERRCLEELAEYVLARRR